MTAETALGNRCRLLRLIRDREGRAHFEQPRILQEMENLGRHMFLVEFNDGTRTFVFPHEIALRHEILK